MADTTEVLQHPAVRAYLVEVHRAVAAKDPAAADGVLAGVADHIRDAAAEADARGDRLDLDAVLRELGDPLLIAADVESITPIASSPMAGRFSDSTGAVILVALLLTLGTAMFTLLGWAAGIWLLWSSQRWSRTEKIVATLWWPAMLLLGSLTPLFGTAGLGGWHLMVLVALFGSLGLGVWLVLRADRFRAPRARPARTAPVARAGALGLTDRWPGGAVAIGAPVVAVVLVIAPALLTGSWSSLPFTATVAALVLAGAVTVLWVSRGWYYQARVWHTGTVVLTALVTGFVVAATISSTRVLRRCGVESCEDLPARLADPSAFGQHLAQTVLPLLIIHAVTTASTFRSGFPVRRSLVGRGAVTGTVLALLVGAGGLTPVVTTASGTVAALPMALAGAAVWSAAAVLLIRSAAWRPRDRVVGIVPALVVVWLCAVGWPFGSLAGSSTDPVNPLVPPQLATDPVVVLALLLGVQLAASVWLLVRAGAFGRVAAR
ncbi:hypothetical protein [Microbacterium sulfonylureivorans]|uniref:hypothetical protein n=1 Tax=Microbacterium sulfonylureivorans TaxID=2486854 RepID=UPI000FDBFEA5|nr:hypothetical protein [Microbacterium sulfonylureivorans]